MKSPSSSQSIPLRHKFAEAWSQFARLLRQRAPWKRRPFGHLDADFCEYRELCADFGFELAGSKAFEVGCGQRPYRLFRLIAGGVDARALDLDRVVLDLSLRDIFASLADNGLERTTKTTLRYFLFDRYENRQLLSYLSSVAGHNFALPAGCISRGSAADPASWPESRFRFIYSEDVFEHIPRDVLPEVCRRIAEHIEPDGVILVRPMVFTGIQGGHHVEWYDADTVLEPKKSAPWDHLREHRHPSNTYLNRMARADYRKLFAHHFDIVEERVRRPGLAHKLLTPDLRAELAAWPEEELFSNQVAFVLRPLGTADA